MTLKAVLFDFNGIIINDEPLHLQLIDDILLQENLSPSPQVTRLYCLGRSDRVGFTELLKSYGRFVDESYLTRLIARKSEAYRLQLQQMEKLPIYPGLADLIFKIRVAKLPMGIVSGALRSEIEIILNRAELFDYFSVIVGGDDIKVSKPEPDGYLLAVDRLNQKYPDLKIRSSDCLAIEDTFAGIEAAKRAGMQVVGVAHTYPFHMLQRQANWTVDYLNDVELERVQEYLKR